MCAKITRKAVQIFIVTGCTFLNSRFVGIEEAARFELMLARPVGGLEEGCLRVSFIAIMSAIDASGK